jgi:hypothetical protein
MVALRSAPRFTALDSEPSACCPLELARELRALIAGWRREWTSAGFDLAPRDAEDGALVQVKQEQPLRRFRAAVDASAARARRLGYRVVSEGPLERFATCEGEDAGQVSLTLEAPDGGTAERTLAIVVGDDSCWLLEGTAARARRVVRLLAELAFLGKGELRQRRYGYQPPSGWALVPHPQCGFLLHPLYPRVPARMLIFDARPRASGAPEELDRLLAIERPAPSRDADELEPVSGASLSGHLYQRPVATSGVGPSLDLWDAVLYDERFVYRCQLEAPRDATSALVAFRALLRSISPVPSRRRD